MQRRQAVVLGAGMAGMACARTLLRDGIRPLLIAPMQDVANRGETLSYRAAPSLDALGWRNLLDSETAVESEGRYSIWGSGALRRGDAHQDEHPGWHIDRQKLQARMAATLDADSIERLVAEVRQLTRAPAEMIVELSDGTSVATDVVIDCTGRAAVSCGPEAALHRLDRLVACYSIHQLDDDVEAASATLVEAVALGWWYMSVIPGGRLLVGLFTDSDLLPSGLRRDFGLWSELAAQTKAVAARLESLGVDLSRSAELEFASAATVAASRLIEPRIIRAGDAATALDPLGANGLATALWSGIRAAESAARWIRDGDVSAMEAYEQTFLQGIASHLSNQAALYASEHRFPDAAFWQRRRPSGLDGGI